MIAIRTAIVACVLAVCLPAAAGAATSPLAGVERVGPRVSTAATGLARAVRFRVRAPGTATGVGVFVDRRSRATQLLVGLYADRRGRPGKLLARGAPSPSPKGDWATVPFRATPVTAGKRYWVALMGRGGELSLRSGWESRRCRRVSSTRRGLTRLSSRWRRARIVRCPSVTLVGERGAAPAQPGGPTAGRRALAGPAQAVVELAKAEPFIRYGRRYPGGAFTNEGWGGGAPMVLAAASYAGNTSADARLLAQMRDTIAGGNEPVANGGYPAQHERWVTGMYAVARHTPRIWDQLTPAERQKIDLVMTGALVASAFTTADANPYVQARSAQYALDGDGNLARDWNPNYREGMIGMMVVGAAYFGGGAAAQAVLDGFDHAAFVANLRAAGLTNMAETFEWKAAHPGDPAPTGAVIQAAVRSYRYYGLSLAQPMDIAWRLSSDTYDTRVGCGLNAGQGLNGAGRIVDGCEQLPNKGQLGQIKEFDTIDAGGPRSAAGYSYDAFRINLVNHYAMLAGGVWQDGTAAVSILARLRVGVPDLWFKLDRGYIGYSKGRIDPVPGASDNIFRSDNENFAFPYSRSLWEDVVRPYHGA